MDCQLFGGSKHRPRGLFEDFENKKGADSMETLIMNSKEAKIFNAILRAWKMRNEGTFTWNDFNLLYEAFKTKTTTEEWKRITYNLERIA